MPSESMTQFELLNINGPNRNGIRFARDRERAGKGTPGSLLQSHNRNIYPYLVNAQHKRKHAENSGNQKHGSGNGIMRRTLILRKDNASLNTQGIVGLEKVFKRGVAQIRSYKQA